jgi:hypothetical protein
MGLLTFRVLRDADKHVSGIGLDRSGEDQNGEAVARDREHGRSDIDGAATGEATRSHLFVNGTAKST